MAEPLSLQVILDPNVSHPVPDAVCFRTGPPGEDTTTYAQPVYADLDTFYHDLIAGRPLPLKFVARRVDDERTILAIALFLNRQLPIHPGLPALLAASALWRDFPAWGRSHVDKDLGRFLAFLRAAVPPSGLDRRTLGERLGAAVGWVRDYVLLGDLPAMPPPPPMPDIKDIGTNGFVWAETDWAASLDEGWVDLFRMGHLRGVLVTGPMGGRRRVRVARKSLWTALNLDAACSVLNEMETAMGQPPGWQVRGDVLDSPGAGTEVEVEHLIALLVRC